MTPETPPPARDPALMCATFLGKTVRAELELIAPHRDAGRANTLGCHDSGPGAQGQPIAAHAVLRLTNDDGVTLHGMLVFE